MKFRNLILLAIIILIGNLLTVSAQVNSVLGQLSNSGVESFAGGISGDGRFVVFESRGNIATENPRNEDNNREIFLFDYAQRRIFQITDTKPLQIDATLGFGSANIKVEIANIRPVISNDGRWIAFGSNATSSVVGQPINGTNPGSFDASSLNVTTNGTTTNILTSDANLEMWVYQVPATVAADLTTGEEIPFTDLNAGIFAQVTNTAASRLPVAASGATGAFIADDNHDAAINDDGGYVAFVSTRNLSTAPTDQLLPFDGNDEIYTFVRSSGAIVAITDTNRGTVSAPIYSVAPSISGNGLRVAFASNAENPIVGMTGGSNADKNEEIYYADLDASGSPSGTKRQITTTVRTNVGDLLNIWSFGKRMSRDGRYIAFDSFADLDSENSGANQTSFALYYFDTQSVVTADNFTRVGPRSDADAGITIGAEVVHYPGFTTVVDSTNTVRTVIAYESRLNITSAGVIPTTAADGLNPNEVRPAQMYYKALAGNDAAKFVRTTKLPTPVAFIPSFQPVLSNTIERTVFNLGLTEQGTGNNDLLQEVFYLLVRKEQVFAPARLSFATGASRQAVTASPVPTPSPTATPTPTPTPSPTPTPTPTPTPSPTPTPTSTPTPTPTPTPVTPAAVQGLAPGMLAIVNYGAGATSPVVARTAVGSLSRAFTYPIELSGVTMTVNGAACGLKSVGQRQIEFVVPSGLATSDAGVSYEVVINNNGTVIKGNVVLVPVRPDIFNKNDFPSQGGRAKAFNVTNPVFTTEPFTVRTLKRRGSRLVPSVIRLHLTGVQNVPALNFIVRIGGVPFGSTNILTQATLIAPGVYAVDFTLPPELAGAGDQPIVVSVLVNGITYSSRLDDTSPRISIL